MAKAASPESALSIAEQAAPLAREAASQDHRFRAVSRLR
jgi:hypothetical protein